MISISDFFINTPIWVWALFLLLITLGIRCGRTRIVGFQSVYTVPSIYIALGISALWSQNADLTSIGGWIFGAILGCIAGWYLNQKQQIKSDKKNRLIELPGEWMTLILILTYFIIRYYYNYKTMQTPPLEQDTNFPLINYFITGALTGFFLGRTIIYIQKYAKAPSIDLKNP